MALDKIVDSSQLDADLTSVADAIRAKGGTSAQLSFPIGMASAIAAISGGGGSLPSSISKIDGGSFTLASDTSGTQINMTHTLGVEPTGYLIWTDDIAYGSTETKIYIVRAFFNAVSYSDTQDAIYYFLRKATSGTFGTTQSPIAITAHAGWVTTSIFNIGVTSNIKAGATYKWLAWA